MSFIYYYCLSMSLMGAYVFTSNRKHLLLMLLSLEFLVLCLFLFLGLILGLMKFEFFFVMLFLTMTVCEGALGLAILVSMIRSHGSDYFQSFNILW
uniref:NADH dehydrogenase subunit 4L n=1 Tax=Sambus kanssuensis TaxID=3045898 RepID=UPI00257A84E0|nr:NADH dehydrogenase subunit 4L [Sambus kanssuensis]WHE42543.1 NADH dehydrogenase subunit 4L [Sambus kanssuensis]